ncbi:MAG: DUF4252 domain-containing protein [Chitinophagales bacterium]
MKKIFIAIALFLPTVLMAQNSLQDFYSKYDGKEGFTSVKISPNALRLMASADADDETMSALSDITGLNVLTFENEDGKSAERAAELTKEAYNLVGSDYQELMSVKETGTDMKILAKSANDSIINDLLIVGQDDDQFVFVDVTGKIDVKKLKSLSDIDVKGLDKLKDVDTEKK